MTKQKEYTAESIISMDDIEHIRIRPGHVVGGANEVGHFVILKEIIDNALDEALAGHAKTIEISLVDDNRRATISDDGRGIPLEIHPKTNRTALASVFALARTGGKFNNEIYGTSVGTHGIGATATNALCSRFKATSFRGAKTGVVEFERGILKTEVIGKSVDKKRFGTTVELTPDYEQIFKDVKAYNVEQVHQRIQDAGYLLNGVKLLFTVDGKQIDIKGGGVNAMLRAKAELKVHSFEGVEFPIVVNGELKAATIDIAFGWKECEDDPSFSSFVNLSRTADGGTHITGVEKGMVGYLMERGKNKCSARELLEGLVVMAHLKHPNPEFNSQTKERLINKDLAKPLSEAVEVCMKSWARKNAAWVDEFLLAAAERFRIREDQKDLKKAFKDLKGKKSARGLLPSKLFGADCPSFKRELYLLEGGSAAGSAVKGRDSSFQEILPLKGKIINAFKSKDAKVIANTEVSDVLAAVGGFENGKFNIEKVRVNKIILMPDADHDGSHIASLLVSLFAQYMKEMLEKGMIFVVDAPLFLAKLPNQKNRIYAHTMEELKAKTGKQFSKCEITRLKGHSEADADEVREYAMNPTTRNLIQLKFTDADYKRAAELMGKDIDERKDLLDL